MELAGDKELFCSKLVRKAFALASDQKVLLPTFSTRFDMKNRDFVERIGVTAKETFAPADIELEPSSTSSPNGRTTASPRACACRIC